MYHFTHYTDILESELNFRKRINPRYSMRGFAKLLNTSPSSLSEILKKKQGLSNNKAQVICQKLNFSDPETDYFCTLVEFHNGRTLSKRKLAQDLLIEMRSKKLTTELQSDFFEIVSNWYNFAIMELLKAKRVPKNANFVANELSISIEQAEKAIQILLNNNLINEKEGYLVDAGMHVTTKDGIPSSAIRNINRALLSKAEKAIEEQASGNRHLSTLTIALDKKILPEVSKKISNFRKELNFFITNHKNNQNPNSVYCFGSQLFELTKSERSFEEKNNEIH
ncbi:TIGR02147 family protein [Bacteriovoracaceae bacterium]|nr:TIGR02147 family protein [Bacteriovoracaceae bacterium]